MGADNVQVDPAVAELYTEYQFRKLVAISHDDFLDEPAAHVAWFPRFAAVDADVQNELTRRNQKT